MLPRWSSFNPEVVAPQPSIQRRRLMRRHASDYLKVLRELRKLAISKARPSDVEEAFREVQSRSSTHESHPSTSSDSGSDSDDEDKPPSLKPYDLRVDKNVIDNGLDKREMTSPDTKTDPCDSAPTTRPSSPAPALEGHDNPTKATTPIDKGPTPYAEPHYTVSKDQLVKLLLHHKRIGALWKKMHEAIQEEKNRNNAVEKYAELSEREKRARAIEHSSHRRISVHVYPQKRQHRQSPLREEWHLDEWLWEKALDDAKRMEEYWHKKDDDGRRVHKI